MMTTSATMQSYLATPAVTRLATGSRSRAVNQFLPSTYVPRLPMNATVRVRSMAKVRRVSRFFFLSFFFFSQVIA
jgi:hypothetical protein